MQHEGHSNTLTETETSGSNSSNSQHQRPTTSSRSRKQHKISCSSSYKGVVSQQNGHWGAQIYANHQRIWLGTFKTELVAAAAYDSAAIKLRQGTSGDAHRNIPWTASTQYEPLFQANYSTEQVLNMIKDGSYQAKFDEFLATSTSQGPGGLTSCSQSQTEGLFRLFLFRKELTPSDVGKLNRLVIPKRYATKFLPTNDKNGGLDLELEQGASSGVDVIIYDKLMRSWTFRYCYWQSSQSYVFTRGWNRFVKEMGLKAKHIVSFYKCVLRENNGKDEKNFCMIDIVPCNEDKSTEIGMQQEKASSSEGKAILPNDKEEKGFRLFGVQIC